MNDNRIRQGRFNVIELLSSGSEGENGDDESDDDEVQVVSPPPKAAKKKAPPPPSADDAPYKKKARQEAPEPKERKKAATNNPSVASLPTTSTTSTVAASRSNAQNQTKFKAATYNIWFENQANPEQRMPALAQALLEQNTSDAPLLFIGFQEVTAVLWQMLKPTLESAGYRLFCQEDAIYGGHYGCAIAVLQQQQSLTNSNISGGVKIIQHGFQAYREDITCQARGFLHVRAQLPNSTKQVLFTTTHLESFMPPGQAGPEKYTGSTQREQQVQTMDQFCHHHMKRFPDLSLAIISGDLNWDDERVQSKGEDKVLTSVLSSNNNEWTDTWFPVRDKRRLAATGTNGKIKKKDEPTCYTYDAKDNPMMGGSLRRRFDRILVRTQNGLNATIDDIELIGRDRIGDTTWTKESNWNGKITSTVKSLAPSDHFGYVAKLTADGV